MSIKTRHFKDSKDFISVAYLERVIENQIMTAEKDDEYWSAWNNAMNKVLELIEDASSSIPNTY